MGGQGGLEEKPYLLGGEHLVVVEDGSPLVALTGQILGRQEQVHALHGERGARIDGHNARVRPLAKHQAEVQLIFVARNVVAVQRLTYNSKGDNSLQLGPNSR